MSPFRAVLVCMRDANDLMVEHERMCFREASGLPSLELVMACERTPGENELSADLLFFGGSGRYSVLDDVPWIRRSVDFLVRVAERKVPAWASCFGFQGLALALGGRVEQVLTEERVGVYPFELTAQGRTDPVARELPPQFMAQLGHHDHVRSLPRGAIPLATSPDGRVEAFHIEGSRFWGAQFHPELDRRTTLERFDHYRAHYGGAKGDAVRERIAAGPDTPEVQGILRAVFAEAKR